MASRQRCLYFGVECAQGHCSSYADLMHVGRLRKFRTESPVIPTSTPNLDQLTSRLGLLSPLHVHHREDCCPHPCRHGLVVTTAGATPAMFKRRVGVHNTGSMRPNDDNVAAVHKTAQQRRHHPVKPCLTCHRSTRTFHVGERIGSGRANRLEARQTCVAAAPLVRCALGELNVTAIVRRLHSSSPLLCSR
jgi:hypothetical protein